jgi:tryptophan-rich sensory protein
MVKRAPLWLMVLLIATVILNVYTVIGTLKMSAAFDMLDVPFSPVARTLFGISWVLIFGAIGVGLWLRQTMAFRLIAPMFTIYGLVNFLWVSAFARADYSNGQGAFQTTITALALLPIWVITIRRGWLQMPSSSALDSVDSHE